MVVLWTFLVVTIGSGAGYEPFVVDLSIARSYTYETQGECEASRAKRVQRITHINKEAPSGITLQVSDCAKVRIMSK